MAEWTVNVAIAWAGLIPLGLGALIIRSLGFARSVDRRLGRIEMHLFGDLKNGVEK